MTLDEAIKYMENISEENQRIVDTGIVFDDVTIDMLYCDDTEVIDEHLANYQICAEKYKQFAEWLKELKKLRKIHDILRQFLVDGESDICEKNSNNTEVLNQEEPKIGYCRDCRWWKDSDGSFKRGIGAESKCPINREEVYEGNGYCFLYEPQESEE